MSRAIPIVKQKTKAELSELAAMVREAFEALGIKVKQSAAYNYMTPATIAVEISGKVRIEKYVYPWTVYFEFKGSRISHISYTGPNIEVKLEAKASFSMNTRKYATAPEQMRERLQEHETRIDDLLKKQRELMHTVSIFDRTVSAALAQFTKKLEVKNVEPTPKLAPVATPLAA